MLSLLQILHTQLNLKHQVDHEQLQIRPIAMLSLWCGRLLILFTLTKDFNFSIMHKALYYFYNNSCIKPYNECDIIMENTTISHLQRNSNINIKKSNWFYTTLFLQDMIRKTRGTQRWFTGLGSENFLNLCMYNSMHTCK